MVTFQIVSIFREMFYGISLIYRTMKLEGTCVIMSNSPLFKQSRHITLLINWSALEYHGDEYFIIVCTCAVDEEDDYEWQGTAQLLGYYIFS